MRWLLVAATVPLFLLGRGDAKQECELLKASLTYTQEEAPRDLSGLLPVVVGRVNQVLDGVVDVEVEWTGGDLHGRVGEHVVQCKVTRLVEVIPGTVNEQHVYRDDRGRDVATQCFHVPFTIKDTDECVLRTGHPMRHQCQAPAQCINTIGSYECICPTLDSKMPPIHTNTEFWALINAQERSPWELSFNTSIRSSCPSKPSTYGCCPPQGDTKDGSSCRASFRCPTDPCLSAQDNDCSPKATCARKSNPVSSPNFLCLCQEGLMGNGRKCRPNDPKPEPKVMYDGVTPTEQTVKANFYCDCTKPIVDACSGFPPCKEKHEVCTVMAGNVPTCACKPGYVRHEKYGCVDERPPLLRLKNDPLGDHTLRLKQGDVYKEYAVEILDENAEEYLRSLKIAYSQALPHGCLTRVGEFHVNYTIAMPWTSPPYVRITRRVVIEDIDECNIDVDKYRDSCPELVPQCDTKNGARCVNTIGSYTCQCPRFTTGDGFQQNISFEDHESPDGFLGGTGCRDTSRPVISLVGPNPRVFRVCECGGIAGLSGRKKGEFDLKLKSQQQEQYGNDIKELVRSTAGAELCATPSKPHPDPSECISAYDETYQGKVNLSKKVSVGEPVQKSSLLWSVPYNVQDEAGNAAETVWRDIVVEEVELSEWEGKIQSATIKEHDAIVRHAVEKALADDRARRQESETAVGSRNKRASIKPCPPCQACECSTGSAFDMAKCKQYCAERLDHCAIDELSWTIRMMMSLETYLPASMIPVALFTVACLTSIMFLRWTLTLMFNPETNRLDYYDERRERAMQESVTYYRSENGVLVGNHGPQPPPRASLSTSVDGGSFFTPRGDAQASGFGSPNGLQPPPRSVSESIYETQPLISPSKTGDGVRRRSPYNTRSR
jgi:hypothetical protein